MAENGPSYRIDHGNIYPLPQREPYVPSLREILRDVLPVAAMIGAAAAYVGWVWLMLAGA